MHCTAGRKHTFSNLSSLVFLLQLPDLLTLVRRGNVALPVDPTHLGCLWVLDR